MDAISNITGNNYSALGSDLRELGALSVGAERLKEAIGTTYLRALVRAAQRTYAISPVVAVGTAHKILYPYILEGVTTDDVKTLPNSNRAPHTTAENKRRALERNARSNFARTAASTLRRFVAAGGDLPGIDFETVTKASLASTEATLEQPAPAFDAQGDVTRHDPTTGEQKAGEAFRRFQRTVAKWAPTSEMERDYKVSFLRSAASHLETAAESV